MADNQNNAKAILATRNAASGFFGMMGEHAAEAWPLAMAAVVTATREQADSVRAFLDSAHGRHFADEVYNGLYADLSLAAAIDAATQKWAGWKISASAHRRYGIPRHLSYLTGFVMYCDDLAYGE